MQAGVRKSILEKEEDWDRDREVMFSSNSDGKVILTKGSMQRCGDYTVKELGWFILRIPGAEMDFKPSKNKML